MWDREVGDLLDVLNGGFPAVELMSGAEARAAVAARRAPVGNLDDVAQTHDREIPGPAGPIPVRIYQPHGASAPRPVIVFLHGGGFVFCDIATHDGFCREMARMTDSLVISVDYRLAPEHRAPAAAEDAYAATCWAAAQADHIGGDPRRLVVAGDSAGGNLAAVTALLATERGGPELAAQVLIFPVLEASCDSPSYERFATGYFNTAAAMRWYWSQYQPDGGTSAPPRHLIEPLLAPSLRGLPTALMVSASLDPLVDENRRLARAFAEQGVPVLHREYGGLFHGFFTIVALRAARAARATLWRDLRRELQVAAPAPGSPHPATDQPEAQGVTS